MKEKRLQVLMRTKGFTQESVAKYLKLTPGNFSRALSQGKMSATQMRKVFNFIDATDEEIVEVMTEGYDG